MESTKKSNKIREIVRLQQILKKWKKIAAASSSNKSSNSQNDTNICPPEAAPNKTNKTTISPTKFLKKTLSFSNLSSSSSSAAAVAESGGGGTTLWSDQQETMVIPKGYLAVCVGREEEEEEMKRFVIPTEYLGHQAFGILLREAEEEFGFQQEGILKIPCEVPVFQNILKMMQHQNHHSSSTSTTTNGGSGKRSSTSSASSSFVLHENQDNTNISSGSGFFSHSPSHSERSSTTPYSSPHLQMTCR